MIKITGTKLNFEREPMRAPFGFKGRYLNELWQIVASLASERFETLGLGVQSVLWSDSEIFATNPESVGNSMMFLMTAYALQKARGCSFETPMDLLGELLPQVEEYGKKITGYSGLRQTFALNSLVAVDTASWLLYSRELVLDSFDQLIPEACKAALSQRHNALANIPLMSYGVPVSTIQKAVEDGFFFLKIKIGSDPEHDGDQDKMLKWDCARLKEIHNAVRDYKTPYTQSGNVLYYLDANGRYHSKEKLSRFLDYAEQIGALERIVILEEPFPEEFEVDVSDLPIRLAADESIHSVADANARIQMGYGALTLKPIAKTLSLSLEIAKVAQEKNIPCFCADLTVNPIMVEWNKNLAARLAPLPGLKIGVVESNGHQNYLHWDEMRSYHPFHGAGWAEPQDGIFHLDEDFYAQSGGIFRQSEHYKSLLK
jgi:L-alanine-DL-glutamate epimerase-like enolase superfamily enzyme